jgi:hypothetical protein
MATELEEKSVITGHVVWELFDEDGNLKARGEADNRITDVGDLLYVSRGAGLTSSATPTGMKLGAGSTAASKNGAGAALVTYLTDSHQAFDATFPSVVSNAGAGGVVTYKVTYAAGKATTASPITECVIITDALANATSTAANTAARILLTGIGSKGAGDSLVVTWTHTILGA